MRPVIQSATSGRNGAIDAETRRSALAPPRTSAHALSSAYPPAYASARASRPPARAHAIAFPSASDRAARARSAPLAPGLLHQGAGRRAGGRDADGSCFQPRGLGAIANEHNANTRDRFIYIHGTPEERNIGLPVSYGCIRMRSQDVIELFDIVGNGAVVKIENQPLESLVPGLKPVPDRFVSTHNFAPSQIR